MNKFCEYVLTHIFYENQLVSENVCMTKVLPFYSYISTNFSAVELSRVSHFFAKTGVCILSLFTCLHAHVHVKLPRTNFVHCSDVCPKRIDFTFDCLFGCKLYTKPLVRHLLICFKYRLIYLHDVRNNYIGWNSILMSRLPSRTGLVETGQCS